MDESKGFALWWQRYSIKTGFYLIIQLELLKRILEMPPNPWPIYISWNFTLYCIHWSYTSWFPRSTPTITESESHPIFIIHLHICFGFLLNCRRVANDSLSFAVNFYDNYRFGGYGYVFLPSTFSASIIVVLRMSVAVFNGLALS